MQLPLIHPRSFDCRELPDQGNPPRKIKGLPIRLMVSQRPSTCLWKVFCVRDPAHGEGNCLGSLCHNQEGILLQTALAAWPSLAPRASIVEKLSVSMKASFRSLCRVKRVTWWACLVRVRCVAFRYKSAVPEDATSACVRAAVQPEPSNTSPSVFQSANYVCKPPSIITCTFSP